ncbi:MAG TPA: CDP-diacylglycerol diphosphatase [Stellaceae bacterium]|nr:CDP-diacylglycerol diphosphatase [Stellaceae bacterium]
MGLIATFLAAFAVLMIADATADRADPSALWQIVHYLCVPDQQRHGNPAPCARVELRRGVARGHVVLKDINGTTQYLLLPTARVSGIESPLLLAPDAPNYFAAAWRARSFVEAAVRHPLPRDDISLAVNSVTGRTQNQLHIHIDCIRADVRAALRRRAAAIGPHWAPLGELLQGHRYRALRVAQPELGGVNPFVALADDLAHPQATMGSETLVVAGMMWGDGTPGFVLLAHRADPAAGDGGSGEELQDHGCAVAAAAAAAALRP